MERMFGPSHIILQSTQSQSQYTYLILHIRIAKPVAGSSHSIKGDPYRYFVGKCGVLNIKYMKRLEIAESYVSSIAASFLQNSKASSLRNLMRIRRVLMVQS